MDDKNKNANKMIKTLQESIAQSMDSLSDMNNCTHQITDNTEIRRFVNNQNTSYKKTVNGQEIPVTKEEIDLMEQAFQHPFFTGKSVPRQNLSNVEAPKTYVVVQCRGCGASKAIEKGSVGVCDYCRSDIAES